MSADFLAATAHDLTTPLVGLRHSIGRNTEDAKFLNERMIRLVENIKDFLRLGGKRRNPDMTEFNIVDSFDEAYRIFREDYREFLNGNDIAKTFIGGDCTQMKVMADETMTIQILWNLLGNDLKYAIPYGGVEVRFVRTEKSVKVEFADEGQGMTARQMRKAFDRYYRAKTALASGKGGFGIGLCTAREFARAMGGDLTVRANSPNSSGIIFVGDSVDKGTQEHYDLLLKAINDTGMTVPMYFALGNHGIVHGVLTTNSWRVFWKT